MKQWLLLNSRKISFTHEYEQFFLRETLGDISKGTFCDRAPCAGFFCQAEKERRAASVHVEVTPGTKINVHPLGATSRARFRPSSLSPLCREPSRVSRFLNDTLMLVYLRAFCMETNLTRKGRFYRTYNSMQLRRKDKEVQRKKGLLNFCIFLPTKTFGGFGFNN